MAIAPNFPEIRPSLNLDFANSKVLDPRITFSRPSSATYYDGKTVTKAEENLLAYSQEFDNTAWTKAATTANANSGVAPDGTSTADSIIESATTAIHTVRSGVGNYLSGLSYTISVYAKQLSGSRYLNIYAPFNVGGSGGGSFDLVNGIANTMAGSAYNNATISAVGSSGWYRCSVSFVAQATSSPTHAVYFNFSTSLGQFETSYVGDGASGAYLWGAQLEQRSSVTAYTHTTSQPITNYIPLLQTAPAGVQRIDHDPITGECNGILIEEQRVNLLTYSEQFYNSAWTKSGSSVVSNFAVAPSGTQSASKLVESSGNALHYIRPANAAIASTVSVSFYAKACERNFASVFLLATAGSVAWFNLSNGTVGPKQSAVVSHSMQSCGNGWYRCTTVYSSIAANDVCISVQNSDSYLAYQGDGNSGIYIWGAQLEVGNFSTSYIKTEASQITRAADQNLMAELGQLGAGTIYMDATVRPGNTLATSGSTTFAATASTRQKTAVAYDAASTLKSINGAAVTSSAGSQGGSNISIAPGATGWIKRLSIYPKKGSEAQLQALTA